MASMKSFLLTYAALVLFTVTGMSFLDITELDLYLAAFAVEFFLSSELLSPSSRSEARRRNLIALGMLMLFIVIAATRLLRGLNLSL